jgi:Domain of unknown function (DUF4112)
MPNLAVKHSTRPAVVIRFLEFLVVKLSLGLHPPLGHEVDPFSNPSRLKGSLYFGRMSFEQVLLTVALTVLTTILVILVVGGVLLLIIVRKIKAQSVLLRGRRELSDDAQMRSALVQVRKIAWLMDDSIPIGRGYRIGIDGVIDFVPGIGDLAGVLVSAYIIYRAAACGAPQPILMRMAGNVLVDALLGTFPVLGVVADSAFKANSRNAAILEEFLNSQERGDGVIDVKSQPATK